MKSVPFLKKQVIILVVFSLLVSIGAIIHGIFLDADISQIKRLTLEGLFLTLVVIIPSLLFLEWVFDLNNKKKFDELEERIKTLEDKSRKRLHSKIK